MTKANIYMYTELSTKKREYRGEEERYLHRS